jgi:outer membrane protein OmpA-like peptidoglycan-associated protein
MSRSFKHFLAISACAAMLPLSALAGVADTRDVVIDKDQKIIKNTFGNCVRTKWDAGHDKCGAQPAAVAKAPKAQPHSRSYIVFFDFDKSELTPDSLSILNNASNDAKAKHATSFTATGHADRAGTVGYNLRLSQTRADAVKQQLNKLDPSVAVKTSAKGESTPLVPTEDGVREPQNRRVEVIFNYAE